MCQLRDEQSQKVKSSQRLRTIYETFLFLQYAFHATYVFVERLGVFSSGQ